MSHQPQPLKYFSPIGAITGALHQQPSGAQRRSDWCCIVSADQVHFADTGFLDAPDIVPAGGTRGMQASTLVLGIAHVRREPT